MQTHETFNILEILENLDSRKLHVKLQRRYFVFASLDRSRKIEWKMLKLLKQVALSISFLDILERGIQYS